MGIDDRPRIDAAAVARYHPIVSADPAYDRIGLGYAQKRRPDPRIFAQLERALTGMQTLVNVGAGTGSYEPRDREVVAVEPSAKMIAQRDPSAAPAVQVSAEALPFPDQHFDASMSLLSIHHWTDLARGLAEVRRVTRYRVVLFTFVPGASEPFWLTEDYFPEFVAEDDGRFPSIERLAELLGGRVNVEPVPIHHDLTDGFLGAYWRRPAAYLDSGVRRGISSFARRDAARVQAGLDRLQSDLETGAWERKYGACRSREAMDLGYRLVVASYER